ncbi:MAG: hypothetical protein VYA55_17015 [Pseudomonadota bacterium]|nr:hypothetical protein [Pseudomonadota bacterium]
MGVVARLNLDAIQQSLHATQRHFDAINGQLAAQRSPLTDEIIANMMEGYAFIDRALAEDVNLLAMGNSALLLELNSLVLLGSEPGKRSDFSSHLQHTQNYFYDNEQGGIGFLMEWQEIHEVDSLWDRVAGLYIQILSQPQLFIEGNHRTAILLVSFVLVREGYPPFVLKPEFAQELLDQSTSIESLKKHSLGMWLRIAGVRRLLADTFRHHLDSRHLLQDMGS